MLKKEREGGRREGKKGERQTSILKDSSALAYGDIGD